MGQILSEQRVRKAAVGDNDQLVALYAECFPFGHSFSYPPYRTEESLAGWLTTLLKRGHSLVMGPIHNSEITRCEVLAIDENRLRLCGVDMPDGTPVLDLKVPLRTQC